MKLPHFDFYPGDWISDTRHLTYEERGAYFDLLCHMWVRGHDCTLPADDRFIAGLLSVSTSKWRQLRLVLVDGVGAVFQITEAGLTNKRLKKEWDKAVTKVQKAKESADARWGTLPNKDANAMRTHSEGNAIEDAMPTECYPEPKLKKEESKEIFDSMDRGVQGGANAPAPRMAKALTPVPKSKSTPAVPFPKDFALTDDMRAWAESEGYSIEVDIPRETREFIEYWTEGEGQDKRKKNWDLTWKTRIRTRFEQIMALRAKVKGGYTNGPTAREITDQKIKQRGRELYGPGAFDGPKTDDIPLLPSARPSPPRY